MPSILNLYRGRSLGAVAESTPSHGRVICLGEGVIARTTLVLCCGAQHGVASAELAFQSFWVGAGLHRPRLAGKPKLEKAIRINIFCLVCKQIHPYAIFAVER